MIRYSRTAALLISVFFFFTIAFGQDGGAKELVEEILSAVKEGGEEAIKSWMKIHKNRVSTEDIKAIAREGVKKGEEKMLTIAHLLAQGKGDEATLAFVQFRIGGHYQLLSNDKKAAAYYRRALLRYRKLKMPWGQGNVYSRMGEIYLKYGGTSKALEMVEKALHFYRQAGNIPGQANMYNKKGNIYLITGDYSKAFKMCDKSLHLFDESSHHFQKPGALSLRAHVYMLQGDIHSKVGEKAIAFTKYEEAMQWFGQEVDPLGQAQVHTRMGAIYHYYGENSKALQVYDEALRLYEKEDSLYGRSQVFLHKGNIYLGTGESYKALQMYDKALTASEKDGGPQGRGDIYMQLGRVYFISGDYRKASRLFDKALVYYEKTGSLQGKGHVYYMKGTMYHTAGMKSKASEMFDNALLSYEKAGAPGAKGNVYLSMVQMYWGSGDNLKRHEALEKARVCFEKSGDLLGLGNVYQKKGLIYSSLHNYLRANEMYDKALLFFGKAGSPLGLGTVFQSKAIDLLEKRETSKALEMFKKARAFFKKSGYKYGQGLANSGMGMSYGRSNKSPKALEMYGKAMPFLKKSLSTVARGMVSFSKGILYYKAGNDLKALELFDEAQDAFKDTGALLPEAGAFFGKAKVLDKLGKKGEALAFFEKSIHNREKLRGQTAFSQMKKVFMKKAYQQYEETLLFMLENNYRKQAFKAAESMRARVFLDQMAEGLVTPDKGLEPGLKKERDKLVAELSALGKKIHETPSGEDEEKYRQLKELYRKAGQDFEELLIKIRLANPLYASVRYPRPITVPQLQKEVLKEGELLLRYVTSTEGTYAFLVSGERFKVIPLDIKEKELKRMINTCLRALTENDSARIKRYGANLYRKLFKPLEPEIEQNKEIIIIPDGHLEKIPFESFISQKQESGPPVFLLEKYRITYIQSASFLSILRKYYRRDGETENFTGFGDPVYDYKTSTQARPGQAVLTGSGQGEVEIKQALRTRYSRSGGTFDRLPASGEEVRAIAGLFKKHHHKTTVFTGAGATEENAKSPQMKDFDYIHFACHGLLNDNFQSLVLSQLPKDKSKEDGYFTLNEIMNCDYHAKLIVLSACKTGSGKMERAEGVTGLTRAVMYAGTPAVVAGLWNVDDRATKELMLYFYRNLLEKSMTKAEALRQAKLELMKHKKYRSPYFWSAFVMYGE